MRLTVDARIVPDAFENAKLPIGWVGSNAIAYVVGSGQQIGADPVYVQRIDSPRRVMIADGVVAADVFGSQLATAGGTTSDLALTVTDVATHKAERMALPAHTRFVLEGYDGGNVQLAWSPGGDRLAMIWQAPSGVWIAVCTIADKKCILGRHRSDLDWNPSHPFISFSLGWLDSEILLVASAPKYQSSASVLGTIPANRPSTHPLPATVPGRRLARPTVFAVTISPGGGYAALVEGTGEKPAVVQVARIAGGKLLLGRSQAMFSGNAIFSGTSSFAAASQAWVGRSVLYATQSFTRSNRLGGSVWLEDAATGARVLRYSRALWGAFRPTVPTLTSLNRGEGNCPAAPSASVEAHPRFGFDAKTSVRQTVAYFRALRQQAFAMADGSCLSTIAEGATLAANLAAIRSLSAGARADVPSDISPRTLMANGKTGFASETAMVSEGESIYRGGRSLHAGAIHSVRVTYTLRLRYLGKPHGFPESRWMVAGAVSTP
jgi:hypothetical protein